MTRINPLPENPFPMFCKWCGRLICYSVLENSDGICSVCAKNALVRWNPKKVPSLTLSDVLISTGRKDRQNVHL